MANTIRGAIRGTWGTIFLCGALVIAILLVTAAYDRYRRTECERQHCKQGTSRLIGNQCLCVEVPAT